MPTETVQPVKPIRLLLLDVDGVQTDGALYYTEKGDELKRFCVRDGIGILRLIKLGIEVGIISHSRNAGIIEKRAEHLGLTRVYCGFRDKAEVLAEWIAELELQAEEVAFIGDDINDLSILKQVGFSACPADAVEAVKSRVSVVLDTAGGQGVVREFVNRYVMDDETWITRQGI